jgi:transketolase
MRAAFADELLALAREDHRIVLLTGDLGFGVLESFAEAYPERFFNVGVAEQNMVGMATGLAEAGLIPFAYSIATFASMRPYEFLRNGGALHELPVRIVGMGAGLDYGHNGVTHFALEDVALMRVQPSVTTVAPADAAQARAALRATMEVRGPIYFRLCKQGEAVAGLEGRFELGRADVIRDGGDVALVVLGNLAGEAVRAADLLEAEGISATVVVVSSLNPSPVADLAELLGTVPVAVAAEAHYVNGGLGSLVCEVVAEQAISCRVIRCGLQEMPRGLSGTLPYLYEQVGLSSSALARTALGALTPARP